MSPITIYTTAACPYCHAAKDLLRKRNLDFTEISVDDDPVARRKLAVKAGGHTSVPQIFFGEVHVGGCDDLYDLDQRGALTTLLADSLR
jgi:glutaredoxin 3